MRTTTAVVLLTVTVLCLGVTARAVEGDPPCQADVERWCGQVPATGSFVQGCLQAHAGQLSAGCRKYVATYTRDTEKLHGACREDLAKHCAKLERPNVAGAKDACLLRHRDALSAKCRETLDATAAR